MNGCDLKLNCVFSLFAWERRVERVQTVQIWMYSTSELTNCLTKLQVMLSLIFMHPCCNTALWALCGSRQTHRWSTCWRVWGPLPRLWRMDLCLSVGGVFTGPFTWSISIPCDGLSVAMWPFNSSGQQQFYSDGRQVAVSQYMFMHCMNMHCLWLPFRLRSRWTHGEVTGIRTILTLTLTPR